MGMPFQAPPNERLSGILTKTLTKDGVQAVTGRRSVDEIRGLACVTIRGIVRQHGCRPCRPTHSFARLCLGVQARTGLSAPHPFMNRVDWGNEEKRNDRGDFHRGGSEIAETARKKLATEGSAITEGYGAFFSCVS